MDAKDFRGLQEAYMDVYEGSAIAGKLADLAQSKANKLFQGNRQWDPNRAKIQILQRISDLAGARNLDKPEPEYAGMTLTPPGGGGKPANLPPTRPVRSRGGSGDVTDPNRDRGNKDQRLSDFVTGKRNNPNLTAKEREEKTRSKPKSRTQTRGSRGGGSSSLPNLGSPSGTTGRYQVGGSPSFGISGIKLADEYDFYDIILSHLLDEGYADTQQAAEAIMVNMSEEWRQSILG